MHAATAAEHQSFAWVHTIFGGNIDVDDPNDVKHSDSDADQRELKVQREMMDVQDQLSRLSGLRI